MINIAGLLVVTAVLIMITLLVISFIFISNIRIERKTKKNRQLKKSLGFLISKAIFHEDEEPGAEMIIPSKYNRLLSHSRNRQCMIDEILSAQKNLSGLAGTNLRKLYERLELNKDAERKLKSRKWHIKAKAIQELAQMDQRNFIKSIYKLVNSNNAYLQMEAQLAVVQLMGFDGLRFLDIVTAPITEWQQMKLIGQLENLPGHELKSPERWLDSKNDSVVLFTIKLIGIYQLAGLHDEVIKCIGHSNNQIRIQAIQCLVEIYNETTVDQLMRLHETGDAKYQVHSLNAISMIDSNNHSNFFYSQLSHADNEVKLAAARALSKTSAAGIISLETFVRSQTDPWKSIIAQVKQELAA